MRHAIPDVKTQQQQQQNFLASIQQQTTFVKDVKPVLPSTSMIKQEDFSLVEQSNQMNCIISMNNGQYQIKQTHPRIIVKDPAKTMSSMMFPTTTGVHHPGNSTISSNIQSESNFLKHFFLVLHGFQLAVLGLYSPHPMLNVDNKKIIIKNEPHFETTTVAYSGNNLNTNLL